MDLQFSSMKVEKTKENNQIEKMIIIGSGPAGLAAALYAARAEVSPLVLTGTEVGGQASLTYMIENYPGYPEGVGGIEMGELFRKQAERFGARIEYETANQVDFSSRPFRISAYGRDYLTETVIIATGASPNHLGVPGEKELTGRGVSYCATCDGWFFKDKRVVVVGGGDSALEEGLFLTRFATSVTVIHRRNELRAGAILQRRAVEHPKISFVWDSVVTEILGGEAVQSVKVKNVKSEEESVLETDGVFIFIGHKPNTGLFKDQLEMNAAGYLLVDEKMRTNIEGVYAAGEVMDPIYRQVVTSAGMGAAAAIQAIKYLEEKS